MDSPLFSDTWHLLLKFDYGFSNWIVYKNFALSDFTIQILCYSPCYYYYYFFLVNGKGSIKFLSATIHLILMRRKNLKLNSDFIKRL